MRKQLFSEEFHKAFKPGFQTLDECIRFKSKSGLKACLADICMAPDWLSVAQINKQLPDMPNLLSPKSNVLEYTEKAGDVRGHRSIEISGYVSATLSEEIEKAIGCLFFYVNMTHAPRKQSLDMVISLEGVSVKKAYRRRKIASTLGALTGQFLADKIATATARLMPAKGAISLYSEFKHEGGEACFNEIADQIVIQGNYLFPMLRVNLDAGW